MILQELIDLGADQLADTDKPTKPGFRVRVPSVSILLRDFTGIPCTSASGRILRMLGQGCKPLELGSFRILFDAVSALPQRIGAPPIRLREMHHTFFEISSPSQQS